MATVENRPSEAMRQARKRRNRWIAAAFFIFVALIITLESPLTRIRIIAVHGNGSIPVAAILRDADVTKGMSLWDVSPARINRRVRDKEPLVQSVAVTTDFIHGVVQLTVHQKHVVALMDVGGTFYPLLNDGVVYNLPGQSKSFSWPIISSQRVTTATNGQATADPNVALLCKALSRLSPAWLASISELHLDKIGTVTVFLNNSFQIRARADGFVSQLDTGITATNYFLAKGYAPGVVDVTGQPPYQYTPLTPSGKGGKG